MAHRAPRSAAVAAILQALLGSAATCFDGAGEFARENWRHCQVLREDMLMYFSATEDGDFMKLGFHVEGVTGAWTALALAGNGGMKGAHQIVVRQVSGEWTAEDRHSEGYETPAMDAQQDVRLIFATEERGSTSWAVLLPMDSCDENDYPMENISRWMHWAMGTSHRFNYHGRVRGHFHANLVAGPARVVEEDFSGLRTVDVFMPKVSLQHLEGPEARNPYICGFFDLKRLMPNRDPAAKQHVVKFAPHLSEKSRKLVHHMLLYDCSGESHFAHGQVMLHCESVPLACSEMKWAWAVGSKDVVMPASVGMPIGAGRRWLALQVHYYNPWLLPGIVDSSGVQLFLTATPRPVDAGVFSLDGGVSPGARQALKPHVHELEIPSFIVPEDCTRQWTAPEIHVFGTGYYGHVLGKHLNVDVVRRGAYVGPLRREHVYDFQHQSIEAPSVSTLRPGDELRLSCSYDTTSRSEPTEFGERTRQEKCLAVMLYYPAQAMNHASIEPEGNLSTWRPLCTRPAEGEGWDEASGCAKLYTQDVFAALGLVGQPRRRAAELCNEHTLSSHELEKMCPPCWSNGDCDDRIALLWGQLYVCRLRCSALSLTQYPESERPAKRLPNHATLCGDSWPHFFRSVPAQHSCVRRGNVTSTAAFAAIKSVIEGPLSVDAAACDASWALLVALAAVYGASQGGLRASG